MCVDSEQKQYMDGVYVCPHIDLIYKRQFVSSAQLKRNRTSGQKLASNLLFANCFSPPVVFIADTHKTDQQDHRAPMPRGN